MVCPKCNSEIYDNRNEKASGVKSTKWPDFKCKNKACDWAQWPPKAGASPIQAAPAFVPPSVPQAHNGASERDLALVRLYWICFDEVLAGLKSRSVTSGFPGSEIAACVATLFIARSKIL